MNVINSDLTSGVGLSDARSLEENLKICYQGASAKAPFDIDENTAQTMLFSPININGRPNSDVIRPVAGAMEMVRANNNKWTIDFGLMSEEDAAQYEAVSYTHLTLPTT